LVRSVIAGSPAQRKISCAPTKRSGWPNRHHRVFRGIHETCRPTAASRQGTTLVIPSQGSSPGQPHAGGRCDRQLRSPARRPWPASTGRNLSSRANDTRAALWVLSLLLALSLERSASKTPGTNEAEPAGQIGSGGCSSTSVVAQGTASKRSNGIGFPDTSLVPYVPSSMRRSARSIFSNVSRSSSLSASTGSMSVTTFASSPSSRISSSRGSVSSSPLLRAASRD
jgi:hypothetical protein